MNIVFDFGGVLFRWQPRAFLARMLPHRATTPEATEALFASVFQGYGGEWAEFDRGRIEPGPLAHWSAASHSLRGACSSIVTSSRITRRTGPATASNASITAPSSSTVPATGTPSPARLLAVPLSTTSKRPGASPSPPA